jgi:predicted ATPase/Tfp pilus assembly protein PilF
MTTANRALFVSDIVDSTGLSWAVGDDEMARLWAKHDHSARGLLAAWSGREIDKSDGMLLLFERMADAAGYALAYHKALAAIGLPLRARVGLHWGPVTLRENSPDDIARGAKPLELEGLAKAIAARVMGIALGGQTLLSDDARAALGDLAPGRLVSHGHWRLQGIPEPLALHELGEEDASFLPPPDARKAWRVVQSEDQWLPVRDLPNNLPAERDSFVGQRAVLGALAARFVDGARLVSLIGIGGTGKTRIAARYARSWLGAFPGGAWFCDLAAARSEDGVLTAVARALDVPLGRADPVQQLTRAIAMRGECMLVLDNFEQVARHAETTLGRWLDGAPQARFLVTTREVLGIVGEQVISVAPMSRDDASELFRQRARAADPDYAPCPDDEAASLELVRVLDGIPLAIELAAARVRMMSPRALLGQMHHRFDLLHSRSGRIDRQATLRGAFAWSWDLLNDTERSALAQLSVFRGGFDLAAAEAVVQSTSHPAMWLTDLLQSLIDKSWLRLVGGERFDLLDTVREYAAAQLVQPGAFSGSGPAACAAAEVRHGQHFATLGAHRAVAHQCADLDNLVVACERAVARSEPITASQTLQWAWAAIQLRGPFRRGLQLAEAVAALPDLVPSVALGVAATHGFALQLCGKPGEARQVLEAALASAEAGGFDVLTARLASMVVDLWLREGREAEAAALCDRSDELLETLRNTGDARQVCTSLNAFGFACQALGRVDEARRHYEAALHLAAETGDQRWIGGSAGNLGQLQANLGHLAEALPLYERAVATSHAIGDRQWEANGRCNLGLLQLQMGRHAEARGELLAALRLVREIGHPRTEAVIHCNLGLVAEALGELDAARVSHEAALAQARALGDRGSEGQFLGYLGMLLARIGDFPTARRHLIQGEALLRSTADRLSLGILLCGRAEAEQMIGETLAAEDAWRDAEALGAALGPVDPASEFGQALARVRAVMQAA